MNWMFLLLSKPILCRWLGLHKGSDQSNSNTSILKLWFVKQLKHFLIVAQSNFTNVKIKSFQRLLICLRTVINYHEECLENLQIEVWSVSQPTKRLDHANYVAVKSANLLCCCSFSFVFLRIKSIKNRSIRFFFRAVVVYLIWAFVVATKVEFCCFLLNLNKKENISFGDLLWIKNCCRLVTGVG